MKIYRRKSFTVVSIDQVIQETRTPQLMTTTMATSSTRRYLPSNNNNPARTVLVARHLLLVQTTNSPRTAAAAVSVLERLWEKVRQNGPSRMIIPTTSGKDGKAANYKKYPYSTLQPFRRTWKVFLFFVVPITFFLPIITLLFVFSRQRLMPASSRSSIEMNQWI